MCLPYDSYMFQSDDAVNPDRLYDLVAVVIHCGSGPNRGHYISIVKSHGFWLLFDDDMVDVSNIFLNFRTVDSSKWHNHESYVYWTVHHLDSWVKRDQLDVASFIISLFNAEHVSDVNTSILRSLRLICWVISWVVLIWFDVCWCYIVVWMWWYGIRMQAEALSRKLLRMDVLTSETCWALNKEIIKQVASSWSLFTQRHNHD